MKKLIRFKSIPHFREVVENIISQSSFIGLDGDKNPIYDYSRPRPTLKFKGTVKLHGTNSAVCMCGDEFWTQAKDDIITIQKDNYGFSFFANARKDSFVNLFNQIRTKYKISESSSIALYGEFCGKTIQKEVAISKIEKSFFIMGIKIAEEGKDNVWLDFSGLRDTENRIYNVLDYKTYEVDIDFNNLEESASKLEEIVLEVENECPIAKEFGFSGLGEGLVWRHELPDNSQIWFKTKGDKHKVVKSKRVVEVDIEKLNTINEFIEYTCTKNRFEQGISVIFQSNNLDIKKMGDLIRWVYNDIVKEEMDTLVRNNLEAKDIGKYVSTKCREYFFEIYNKH